MLDANVNVAVVPVIEADVISVSGWRNGEYARSSTPTAAASLLMRTSAMLGSSLSTSTTGVQSAGEGIVTVVIGCGSQPAVHASIVIVPPLPSARTNSSTVRCAAGNTIRASFGHGSRRYAPLLWPGIARLGEQLGYVNGPAPASNVSTVGGGSVAARAGAARTSRTSSANGIARISGSVRSC